MRRRTWLLGASGLLLVGAGGRPDVLPLRTAHFEEVGDSILMTLGFPGLFPRWDRDAWASVDSGFATTIRYDLKVHEVGALNPLAAPVRLVNLQYDFWHKQYQVTTRDLGRGEARRYFSSAEEAVRHAVELRRIRLVRASTLVRSTHGPYYYVSILAQRNPSTSAGEPRPDAVGGRAQGRDVRWFAHLVEFLAGGSPEAEETLHVRTNPFYLVPR